MIELELRDIHLPDGISWWPPAPGWWLLLLLLLALSIAVYRLRHRFGPAPCVRASLRELERIRRDHEAGRVDRRGTLVAAAQLLRRVAMAYCGRQDAAARTGPAWVEQLGALSTRPVFDAAQLEWLARDRYRAGADIDVVALLEACQHWIESLPRERSHAAV